LSAIFRPRHINGKRIGAAPSSAWRRSKPVTGDLAKGGVEQYANLSVSGNRVR
jgi:hypothetical protein